jgi:hypothetical protein
VNDLARPHPFELVFGPLVDVHFPAIREVLAADADLDAFLVCTPAIELLQELRPDDGLGDAVDDFVAFVHAAWRFWADGAVTSTLDADATRALCGSDARATPTGPRMVQYIQVAPRLVWGQLADGEQWEPLDGWFALPDPAGLRVVACFGLHPERPGLTVAAVTGMAPPAVPRADGSSPFAPQMPGGDLAGLHALADTGELLLLAWRAAATPS